MNIKERWVAWEELLPGFTPATNIDFQQVGGMAPGSIPFAGATGFLAQDNANLFWDEANARLGIGTSAPDDDCAFHIKFPAVEVVLSRLSAKERPWRQWECIDGDWGLAIGIHANDGKIHLNYDSPIGTRIQSMIVFDGPNARVGIQEDAPAFPLDIGVATRLQSSLQVDTTLDVTGAVTFDSTLGVTGDTTLSKVIVTGNAEDGLNLTSTSSQIHFTGGAGEKGIKYKDTGAGIRFAMRFPDGSDVVEVLNRAANGTVEIHANTAVAGAGGDVKVAEFQDDIINFFVGLNITGILTLENTGLHLLDTGGDHDLIIKPGTDLSADRILTITTGDAARTITLSGNPTLDDWFDQEVKEASSPSFAGLYIKNSGELRFYDNGNYVGFEAPALAANQIWVLPAADGDANDVLITDGGGNLAWAAGGVTDEKVKVDVAAVAGYLGAAFNDGVLRTGATLTYADGGDFVTLGVDPSAIKLDDLGAPDDNTDLDFSTAKHGLCPKGTDVGNFLKDDGTWAAGGGGESNTASNQGSGVSIYFQKVGVDLQFNAIKSENNRLAVALDGATHDVELTLVEGNIDHDALLNTHANPYKLDDLAAPDDNADLDFSTTKHGLAPKGTDVGDYLKDDGTWDTPLGAAAINYLDNFEDASIHWSWRTDNLDGDRTIVEAANKLTIAVAAGTNYNWWSTMNDAPKIFTGIGRPPCEIITKLITITTNNETRAGIFVASNPIGVGADYAMLLGRRTVGGVESLQVQRLGTAYTAYGGAPFTTLPIWLKIQITADIRYGNHIRFYYSVNGVDWTEMGDPAGGYSDLLTSDGFVVGLFAQNWNELAVSAEFDFFKVVPSLGADG